MIIEYYFRILYKQIQHSLYKDKLKRLQQKYGFNDWHLSPLFEREYAQYIVRLVNAGGGVDTIVDVGCGLGEIVGHISARKKYGYDINQRNILAASKLYPDVEFGKGTFSDVCLGRIDVLIMVNFTFAIPPKELKEQIGMMKDRNEISVFVIDTFLNNENTEYSFAHDGNYLFSGEYRLLRRSRPFYYQGKTGKARRYIEFWGRKSDFY